MSLGAALVCAACSTTSGTEEAAASRFLPTLPAMPSIPTMNVADISIPGTNRHAPEIDHDLEPVVYWRVIEDDILVVHAQSNGCTARTDFQLDVEQYHENIYTVRLVRDFDDRCADDVPWGIQLGFGFEELGVPIGGQILVLNPLDQRPWDWGQRDEVRTVAAR